MKLKQKLVEEYLLYCTDFSSRDAYLSGFEKARELCAELVESLGNKNLALLIKSVAEGDNEESNGIDRTLPPEIFY